MSNVNDITGRTGGCRVDSPQYGQQYMLLIMHVLKKTQKADGKWMHGINKIHISKLDMYKCICAISIYLTDA